MSRTFRQTHHDTQSQIFFLHFKALPKIIQKISFCSSDYMLRPSHPRPPPPPPYPYMRIACMHITESVSFTSCLINSTVIFHCYIKVQISLRDVVAVIRKSRGSRVQFRASLAYQMRLIEVKSPCNFRCLWDVNPNL